MNQQQLITELTAAGVLHNPRLKQAFESIDRADFVPVELKDEAYSDRPLAIGHGQTISQPFTVAFMLDLLEPTLSDNILEIGFGSGWQTALLAYIVSTSLPDDSPTTKSGQVTALELIPALCRKGIANLSHYDFIEHGIVTTHCQNASAGFPTNAPYDCIIAAAAADEIPTAWVNQLASGGRLVAPVANTIVRLTKNQSGEISRDEYPGFVFVPFVE